MQKFSAWSLLKEAFNGHQGWKSQWRRAAPKAEYDAIVIGAGVMGASIAFHLAERGLKTYMDVRTDLSHSLQIRSVASLAAVRMEEKKVVEIACDEA